MSHEIALQTALQSKNAVKDAQAFAGDWKNQMASTMHLEVQGDDVIGQYTTTTSATDGGGPLTASLIGKVSGDRIAFVVLWKEGSITSWTGQLTDDATSSPRIRTLWHLVTDISDADEPKHLWQSTFAGADEFSRA